MKERFDFIRFFFFFAKMCYNYNEKILRSDSNEESNYIFGNGSWNKCNGTFRRALLSRRKKMCNKRF